MTQQELQEKQENLDKLRVVTFSPANVKLVEKE